MDVRWFLLLGLVFLVGCSTQVDNSDDDDGDDLYDYVPLNDEIMETEDGVKYLVHPDKIRRGIGLPGDIKDVIPSIDNPKFISVGEADQWIEDNELVLALNYKGVKRVYPLQVLVFHEIVNDNVAGDAILITYCPLCGSGIAYEGVINGEGVEFGTSGKLFNSNLIMYDRKTESYWTQIDGKAVVGELTGMELKEISIDTVVWRDYKGPHADAEVLSRDTGFTKPYGRDPYGGYYENSNLFFPVENEDNSVHPKTVIFGIEVDGVYKAYKEEDLLSQGIVEDVVNGVNVKVERDSVGIVTITNEDTGEEIVKERDFWFAWYAFHPNTELYENG